MVAYYGTWVLYIPILRVATIKHTCKQCNLDRLKSESKEDTNKTPTCAVSCTHRRRFMVRGGGGYNQGSFVYFAKG